MERHFDGVLFNPYPEVGATFIPILRVRKLSF